jgi:hypothetical protein
MSNQFGNSLSRSEQFRADEINYTRTLCCCAMPPNNRAGAKLEHIKNLMMDGLCALNSGRGCV